jgi:methylmalonyl-CoA mutase C-terminal domain/subunit
MEGTRLFVGGIIPTQDIEPLRKMGVSEVFLPGASLKDIVERVERTVAAN